MEARVERMGKMFLSLPETAEFAGIGKSTVLRYEKAGLFPKRKKLGPGRVGWSIKELEDWALEREPAFLPGLVSEEDWSKTIAEAAFSKIADVVDWARGIRPEEIARAQGIHDEVVPALPDSTTSLPLPPGLGPEGDPQPSEGDGETPG